VSKTILQRVPDAYVHRKNKIFPSKVNTRITYKTTRHLNDVLKNIEII
jgi:hypothetical protein